MSRVQLAINVSDLEASIGFYSSIFGVEPAKRQEGYANFVIENPPLKLVLMEMGDQRGEGVQGALNHLGVEVEEAEAVVSAAKDFEAKGLITDFQEQTDCCFAIQDKVWVNDPDGTPWEVYTVLSDSSVPSPAPGCCTPSASGEPSCC